MATNNGTQGIEGRESGIEAGEEVGGDGVVADGLVEDDSRGVAIDPPPPVIPPAVQRPVEVSVPANQPVVVTSPGPSPAAASMARQPVYPPARQRRHTVLQPPSRQSVYEPEDEDEPLRRSSRGSGDGAPPPAGKAFKWILVGVVVFFALANLIVGGIYASKKMGNGATKVEKTVVTEVKDDPCKACKPQDLSISKMDEKDRFLFSGTCTGPAACASCNVTDCPAADTDEAKKSCPCK